MMFIAAASASASTEASPQATLLIAVVLLGLGCFLAFNVLNVAATLLANSSGFTARGRRRVRWRGPNPYRLVGAFFLVGGIAVLISALVRIA
jgi:hypothetical protein